MESSILNIALEDKRPTLIHDNISDIIYNTYRMFTCSKQPTAVGQQNRADLKNIANITKLVNKFIIVPHMIKYTLTACVKY